MINTMGSLLGTCGTGMRRAYRWGEDGRRAARNITFSRTRSTDSDVESKDGEGDLEPINKESDEPQVNQTVFAQLPQPPLQLIVLFQPLNLRHLQVTIHKILIHILIIYQIITFIIPQITPHSCKMDTHLHTNSINFNFVTHLIWDTNILRAQALLRLIHIQLFVL